MCIASRIAFTVSVFALSGVLALATPVGGTFDTTGSVTVGMTTIDFAPLGGGSGAFSVAPAPLPTGSFAALGGTVGTILDLSSLPANQPVGVGIWLPSFMTFSADPNLDFGLRYIQAGTFPSTACGLLAAPGQICTPNLGNPPYSPFNMGNITATSSYAAFQAWGYVNDLSDPAPGWDDGLWVGTFSTQFTTMPFQQVLAIVQGGGTVTASYSANFAVIPIPEPSTLSFLGIGLALVGVGAFVRRRRG